MDNTNKIIAGIGVAGAIAIGATVPVVPVDDVDYITNIENAKTERKYHKEREQYYRQNNMDQKYIDQAVYARDLVETRMLEKEMITFKGEPDDKIKEAKKIRKSVVDVVASADYPQIVERAYAALLFGEEDLEGGAIPASFDDVYDWYGLTTVVLDSTSKVGGTYSLKFNATGEGSSRAEADLGTESDERWIRFDGYIETGFAWGASGYTGIWQARNTAGTQALRANIEDYGTARLTFGGAGTTYTNTGIDLPIGTPFTLQFRIKTDSTIGEIDVWLDNDVEGSPDYSVDKATGDIDMRWFDFGYYYNPEALTGVYYLDNFNVGDAFIVDSVGGGGPTNGRVDFVAAWDPDIYWELNTTNLGTNFGDDPTGVNADNLAVSAGEISTQDGYQGMNNQNDDGQNSHWDIHITVDQAALVYIPADMTHSTVYGLWHNGGGTHAQGMFVRPTATGVEVACSQNNGGDNVDAVIEEIPDASLPSWFMFGCQIASYNGVEGDMALWIDGVAVRSGTRTFATAYGSGDPDFGDNGGREPNASTVLDPASYSGGDWGGNTSINSSGILIANFTTDNPFGDNTAPVGNGNNFYTDYYDYHWTVVEPVSGSTPQSIIWFD